MEDFGAFVICLLWKLRNEFYSKHSMLLDLLKQYIEPYSVYETSAIIHIEVTTKCVSYNM